MLAKIYFIFMESFETRKGFNSYKLKIKQVVREYCAIYTFLHTLIIEKIM